GQEQVTPSPSVAPGQTQAGCGGLGVGPGTSCFLILVSASRDKTLRIWDLSRDGRSAGGGPWC
uniref:Uncharacterized protein n=1 Tax=Athene cunicularia TaxID=194338 RepID=A0A663LZ62_ATHCN